jgi:hypothetical protein
MKGREESRKGAIESNASREHRVRDCTVVSIISLARSRQCGFIEIMVRGGRKGE